jgi:glycosyltransferase involved in cell wall biosynthesis
MPPAISVVVPIRNEADHVEALYREIRRVLDERGESFEIVFVDDGSTDETRERLLGLRQDDRRLRVLELDSTFGEAAALSAGLHHASGNVVVTIDAERDDPADIPKLLDELERDGINVVSGYREERHENALSSRIVDALIGRVTGVPLHDPGCTLKAYRRSALAPIHLPPGMNRFLPAILGVGASEVAEIPIRDRSRPHGSSGYGIGRTVAVLRDLLALRSIIRDPRRAEIAFALFTATAAGLGAVLMQLSPLLTAACDIAAVLFGSVWWNARRFNRAQREGVYRLRDDRDSQA